MLVSLAATHELQRRKGGDVMHDVHTPKELEIAAASSRMEEAPLAENASEDGETQGGPAQAAPATASDTILPKSVERSA